jgi:hypothetical protein
MKTRPTDTPPWITFACAALLASGALAQEKPFTQPPLIAKPPAPPPTTVATNLTEVFSKGKIGLNALLRYEYADQRNLKESYLGSIRTRFGFTTATYEGFQAQLEAENITALTDEDKFNAAGSNGQPGRTVIADPETTEINQAWVSYTKFDTTAKLGRQRIVFDNSRWIGDVIWRQNQQTYDAMLFQNKSVKNLDIIYSYVWHANRIFGDVTGLPIANQDLDSNSHLLHADYTGFQWAKLTGYVYLLDFNNDLPNVVARNLSSATYGGYLQGSRTWDKENNGKVNYRGEFAWQTDYGSSALDYSAPFLSVEVTGDYDRFTLGAGYEYQGSDNNQSLRMPFSTLHAFNGWADVFLTSPAPSNGLQDLYAVAAVKLPYDIPLRALYHQFYSAKGGADYGREILVATKKIGKYVTLLVKYAHYEAGDAFQFAAPPAAPVAPYDKDVFWAQVEFNY